MLHARSAAMALPQYVACSSAACYHEKLRVGIPTPVTAVLHSWFGVLPWPHPCLPTGHSLGGALATLAAFDIRKKLLHSKQRDVEVTCYTFAAPRTGNHAFAQDYNALIPDTWSIINDQVSAGAFAHYAVSISYVHALTTGIPHLYSSALVW